MTVPVRLAAFGVALVAVFAIAYDAGQLVGPTGATEQRQPDREHTP